MNGNLPTTELLTQPVFSIKNDKDFATIALAVFKFQYQQNKVYQAYCNLVHKNPEAITEIRDIPFLPISFFKTAEVVTTAFDPQAIFESSRTTGTTASRHLIKDVLLYEHSFLAAFELFYGSPQDYCFLGLLPSYLER